MAAKTRHEEEAEALANQYSGAIGHAILADDDEDPSRCQSCSTPGYAQCVLPAGHTGPHSARKVAP